MRTINQRDVPDEMSKMELNFVKSLCPRHQNKLTLFCICYTIFIRIIYTQITELKSDNAIHCFLSLSRLQISISTLILLYYACYLLCCFTQLLLPFLSIYFGPNFIIAPKVFTQIPKLFKWYVGHHQLDILLGIVLRFAHEFKYFYSRR